MNEVEVAYSAIPEAEREGWYKRAARAMAESGVPIWLRIKPMIQEAAVRMWLGETVAAAG